MVLLKLRFFKPKANSSLFIIITTQSATYLFIYMDDVILTESNEDEIQALI